MIYTGDSGALSLIMPAFLRFKLGFLSAALYKTRSSVESCVKSSNKAACYFSLLYLKRSSPIWLMVCYILWVEFSAKNSAWYWRPKHLFRTLFSWVRSKIIELYFGSSFAKAASSSSLCFSIFFIRVVLLSHFAYYFA